MNVQFVKFAFLKHQQKNKKHVSSAKGKVDPNKKNNILCLNIDAGLKARNCQYLMFSSVNLYAKQSSYKILLQKDKTIGQGGLPRSI